METTEPDEDGNVECRCEACGAYWVAGPEDNHDHCQDCEQDDGKPAKRSKKAKGER